MLVYQRVSKCWVKFGRCFWNSLICTIKDFSLFKFNCLLFRWLNIGGAGFLNIVYFSAGGKYMNIWTCDVSSAGESNLNWLVVWNIAFILHNIWVVILPIDELHHFSRWLLHHQPVVFLETPKEEFPLKNSSVVVVNQTVPLERRSQDQSPGAKKSKFKRFMDVTLWLWLT